MWFQSLEFSVYCTVVKYYFSGVERELEEPSSRNDCFDTAVVSSYSPPKLFCLEQLQLSTPKARDGGQGTDISALPLRGGRCTSAGAQLCTSVAKHVA